MIPDEISSSLQPDLEEFLSALDGFVSKQTTPTDPSNLRFLEIFFRSVKSEKGHLLTVTDSGQLNSAVSYGIAASFDDEFNQTHALHEQEPCPLDLAFRDKDAVAIVDLSKEPDVPAWFMDLMKKYGFVSLVAVPLLGNQEPVGILCAYYHDVCLFDRGTLGHLMMIGRMVGQASEKSRAAGQAESHGEKDKVVDLYLRILLGKLFNKTQTYGLLAKLIADTMNVSGMVCGPVTKTNRGLNLTVAGAAGIPAAVVSQQFLLPGFVSTKLMPKVNRGGLGAGLTNDWGELKSLVKGPVVNELFQPLIWQNRLEGLVLAWRNGERPFHNEDDRLLSRLAGISSLAIHTAS